MGCHNDTGSPLGTLAKAALRKLRMETHAAFDPVWQLLEIGNGWSRSKARSTAYTWLAGQMHIAADQCHIGMFDEIACRHALQVLNRNDPVSTCRDLTSGA